MTHPGTQQAVLTTEPFTDGKTTYFVVADLNIVLDVANKSR
jgi:hypothetical protein